VIGVRPIQNRGGPLKMRKDDCVMGGPYGGGKAMNERRDGRYDWAIPKLVVSLKDIVKDVNIARLLRFP